MIIVCCRVPVELTPLGDWLGEVADDLVIVTSAERAAGYQAPPGKSWPSRTTAPHRT